ncbi:MAG: hypothetical protein A07HN63_01189 [uncultured archaeon A07HN63]|nr:MAG: hypothetical protein A07HN63_01189 [uncultured archaeon A07HN63]
MEDGSRTAGPGEAAGNGDSGEAARADPWSHDFEQAEPVTGETAVENVQGTPTDHNGDDASNETTDGSVGDETTDTSDGSTDDQETG